MQPDTETVLERRRLRRGLSWWRGLAVLGLALAAGAWVFGSDELTKFTTSKQIARVAIEGTIVEDREQLAMLKQLKENKGVEGVIVFVNSPGGTTTGGEGLYNALRDLAKEKPVVAQFGTVAASAGYIVGLGTDHIVSRGNTITGSVGVIAQWPEVSDLMAKIGVKMNEVKSGDLKASPSFYAPVDEPSRQVMQALIDDGFKWFIALVEDRRGIKAADVPGLEQGKIFSGRSAVEAKLVDEIGGEEEAQRWLEEKRGVTKDLKIVDWKPSLPRGMGLFSSTGSISDRLAGAIINRGAGLLTGSQGLGGLGLDGLVSVWQPSEK